MRMAQERMSRTGFVRPPGTVCRRQEYDSSLCWLVQKPEPGTGEEQVNGISVLAMLVESP